MMFSVKSSVIAVAAGLMLGAVQAELAPSANFARPLSKGALTPDATVQTPDGKAVSLKAALGGKPTVLIFFRGGWCPFCTRHLSELNEARADLAALGYEMVAVTADPPEALPGVADKNNLGYTLLSDARMQAAEAFGLAFKVDDATLKKYREYNIKLTAKKGDDYWLPVPAVFLVGVDGKIQFAHANPDYKARLSKDDLLKAARAVVAAKAPANP